MVGIGSELQRKAGPLPVWAWAGLGTVGLAGFLIVRKKQSMDQQATGEGDLTSSVVGGPSNLIPQAMPMPYSQGDTFVNTTINNIPPGGSTKAKPPPPKPPTLPVINPAKYPKKVKQNSAFGKTFIKIGCFDLKGHYTGKQVGGHVPVYGLSGASKTFAQGPLATAKGHCVYIPGEFKAYIQG